jgi:hypothetical protein
MKRHRNNFDVNRLRTLAGEINHRDNLKISCTKIKFMDQKELLNFIAIHGHSELPDDMNPAFIFSSTHTDLLVTALEGEINLMDLVKQQLEGRLYKFS